MKMGKKREKLKIVRHGTLYEEVNRDERCLICPECGCEEVMSTRQNDKKERFFKTFEFCETDYFCKCRECGCEWKIFESQRLVRVKIWDIFAVSCILSLVVALILGFLMGFVEKTDGLAMAILSCVVYFLSSAFILAATNPYD